MKETVSWYKHELVTHSITILQPLIFLYLIKSVFISQRDIQMCMC